MPIEILETAKSEQRLAVLIDADNAPRTAMKDVMEEIAIYGNPTIKRIYGDWTTPNLATWKPILLDNAITPMQQYAYTSGKNSTDSAMIIDAMDILYSGNINGFVLVSSDSDFTRLAIRLREAGMKVYGMGEKKTPDPFIKACDKFVYIENIRAAADEKLEIVVAKGKGANAKDKKPDAATPATAAKKISKPTIKLLVDSLNDITDDDGFGSLGELGSLLIKKRPDFDPRNFGYTKLSHLVKAIDRFEVDERSVPNSKAKQIYLRDKQAK